MKRVLRIVAAIALTAIAAAANAGQDKSAYSTKPWLGAKRATIVRGQAGTVTAERMCSKCRVPETINEQVATKPGHGTVPTTMFVDRCPGCTLKPVTELKQTKIVHTCSNHCCGA